jgi:Ulp1 family protease
MSDCGVFMLHYAELFALRRPATIEGFTEWFTDAEVDVKR